MCICTNPYVDFKLVNKYDDNNTLKETFFYQQNDSVHFYITKYRYDESNKLLEKYIFFLGNIVESVVYIYDDFWKVEQINTEYKGNNFKKTISKFDIDGNLIEETNRKFDGSTDSWIHEYTKDEKRNWIIRIDYLNGTPKYYLERKIEYYESL